MTTNRTVGAVLACLLACALLAACGSSASSSSSSSSAVASGGTTGFAAARAKLAACLKQHGVTLPSRPGAFRHRYTPGSANGGSNSGRGGPPPGSFGAGGFGGGGGLRGRLRADPKLQAAFKACAPELPRHGFAFSGAGRRAAIAKFVTCVRQHGYDLPKPNFSGNGPVFPSRIRTNPRFRDASQACAKLLVPRGAPGRGRAAPGSTPPTA